MNRGDIHYIVETPTVGSEQRAGRPAVIVSNNNINERLGTVEVVFLTTRPKADHPTHVTVRATRLSSTALCEQVTTVSVERVGDYVATCSSNELMLIDQGISISLGLATQVAPENPKLVEDLRYRLRTAEQERDMYRMMYDKILDKFIDRRDTNDKR